MEAVVVELSYLKEFVYLAETLSFKRTAEHFYVSRSVISRHLASIEESLGAKLLERGGQTVRLTDEGEVFYGEARIVLQDYERAIERVQSVKNSHGKTARIGYLRNAARPVNVPFLRFMQTHHPDLKITMTCMEYGELRNSLEDGVVDVAIAVNVEPEVSRNYRLTHIYDDRLSAVMSKTHPLAGRSGGISIEDVPADKLLLPDSLVYAGLSDMLDIQAENKTQLIARAFYSDVDMLFLKVQTEEYVALSSGMNNVIFGNNLAIVPVNDIKAEFSVSAFYRKGLSEDVFAMCREGFEACRSALGGQGLEGIAGEPGHDANEHEQDASLPDAGCFE